MKNRIVAALALAHERVYQIDELGKADRAIFERIADVVCASDDPRDDLLNYARIIATAAADLA